MRGFLNRFFNTTDVEIASKIINHLHRARQSARRGAKCYLREGCWPSKKVNRDVFWFACRVDIHTRCVWTQVNTLASKRAPHSRNSEDY